MKKIIYITCILCFMGTPLLAQQAASCAENVAAVDTTMVVENTLQASNTLTINRKLSLGDTLRLIGGQVIELLPGFEADYGSFVEGENGECIELNAECFEPCQTIGLLLTQNEECFYEWQNEDVASEDKNSPQIEVCPEETTTYTLKIVRTDGTIEERNYEVEIFDLSFKEDSYYLCEGENEIKLELNNPTRGYTYEWSDREDGSVLGTGPNYTVATTGTYYVTVSDPCGNTYSESVSVESAAAPNIVLDNPDPSICFDDPPQLNTDLSKKSTTVCALNEVNISVEQEEDFTYEWSNGSSSNSTMISTIGDYALTVTDEKGCMAVEEFYVDECVDCNLDDKLKDYRFLFLDQEFKSGEEAFLCLDMLPTPIEVFNTKGDPVPDGLWEGGSFGNETIPNTILNELDNNEGQTLTYTFLEEDGTEIIMMLHINTNVNAETHFTNESRQNNDKYAEDSNQISAYPYYNTAPPRDGIPWKFLETNQDGKIQAKAIPPKAYYATELKGNGIVIDPTPLASKGWNEVTLNTSTTTDDTNITVCTSDDPLFKVYAANRKDIQVQFFLVCESDDDIQVNFGQVNSPDAVCIDSGPDGTFDEEEKINQEWMANGNVVVFRDGRRMIIAGDDMECRTTVKAFKSPRDCPDEPTEEQLENYLNNEILESMGVYLEKIGTLKTIDVNYDILEEDSRLEGQREIVNIHEHKDVENAIENGQLPICIISNFDDDNRAATNYNPPVENQPRSIYVESIDIRSVGERQIVTLAHEVGHANGLEHPNDGDDEFMVDDQTNFMNSSVEVGNMVPIRNLIKRRYQWSEIRRDN